MMMMSNAKYLTTGNCGGIVIEVRFTTGTGMVGAGGLSRQGLLLPLVYSSKRDDLDCVIDDPVLTDMWLDFGIVSELEPSSARVAVLCSDSVISVESFMLSTGCVSLSMLRCVGNKVRRNVVLLVSKVTRFECFASRSPDWRKQRRRKANLKFKGASGVPGEILARVSPKL